MIVTLIIIHFQQKFPRGRWGTLSPVQEAPPMCTDLSLPDLPGDGRAITSGKEVEREVSGYQYMGVGCGVVFTKTGE